MMNCANCGAAFQEESSRECSYCGAVVEVRSQAGAGPFSLFADADGDGMPDIFEAAGSVSTHVSTRFVVNGQEYSSVDEMPAEIREHFRDIDLSSPTKGHTTTRVASRSATTRDATFHPAGEFTPRQLPERRRGWLWPFVLGLVAAWILFRVIL